MSSSMALSKTLMNDRMGGTLNKMKENLEQIERKVKPIAVMAETVKSCKENINIALEQINRVTTNIAE